MTDTDIIFRGVGSNGQSGTGIHPTAQVSATAELGSAVLIGPNAIIGPSVKLADGVRVGSGAVVDGRTTIGRETTIYPFATVGSVPQDLKYDGEDTEVVIGARNKIREYVNISLGTDGGGGKTVIGDDNLIMLYTHIGHDCIVGNQNIFANGVQLAGHVTVGDAVVFGGLSAAHQFSKFGSLVMVAGGSMVSQDVPPFCMVQGDRAKINGLNVVGIRRAKTKMLSQIKAMYRLTYNEDLTLADACERIESEVEACSEKDLFLDFLRNSARGIVR